MIGNIYKSSIILKNLIKGLNMDEKMNPNFHI